MLDNEENISRFNQRLLKEGTHENNLFMLYHISTILKHGRLRIGKGIDFASESTKIHVAYKNEPVGTNKVPNGYKVQIEPNAHLEAPEITVTREVNQLYTSKSQQLVSNFMIAGNYGGCLFAQKRNIPIIHRTQELGVSTPVRRKLAAISRQMYSNKGVATVEQQSQIFSVMISANYEVTGKRHDCLGLDLYLNFTSPLRRYVDMINHWIIQEYVSKERNEAKETEESEKFGQFGQSEESSDPKESKSPDGPVFTKQDLEFIASHLQSREYINKSAQRFSERFWLCKFLEEYFKIKTNHVTEPIEFSFLLKSEPKFGDVRAEMIGFKGVKITIVKTDGLMEKFDKKMYRVGQVILSEFKVLMLDFIEGEIALELL